MEIDQTLFLSILSQTLEDNPLACRAALAVDKVEFSNEVQTLSVSLGRTSTLKVNLDFIRRHCATEKHVQALLVHEFLHIALGHTMKFDEMTPGLNVALDAVINAIIHRKLGVEYSSMMANYYSDAKGLLKLLRPMEEGDRRSTNIDSLNRRPVDPMNALHAALYNGTVLADDVLSIARDCATETRLRGIRGRPNFLGDHSGESWRRRKVEGEVESRIRRTLVCLDGVGVFRDPRFCHPQSLKPPERTSGLCPTWRNSTAAVLKRLLVPDRSGGVPQYSEISHHLPILHSGDRRGVLKSIWNPIIPEISWTNPRRERGGSVQVYLDVSASMNGVLRHLVRLLAEFGSYIRKPLWAFSTEICEAKIVGGELTARTTGGTRLGCVYEHLRKTKPDRALVITDGFVEDGKPAGTNLCHIEAIIPHDGHDTILSKIHGIPVTRLGRVAP